MPDLTIKPNVGNGNKVIIQDQAGTPVLTTSDAGATAANVTLASTTTFPSGMPVKVTQGGTTTKHASGNNTNYTDWPNFTHNHTMRTAQNQILLTCSFVSYGNGVGMGKVKILEGTDGSNWPTTRWESTVLGYADNENGWVSFQKLFTAPAGATLYWKVQVGRYNGSSVFHWGGNTSHSDMNNFSSITIMEIQA